MHRQKRIMLAINVLGGTAVIGSYVWGFATHPGAGDALWGGVPAALRPVYTANMLAAALGYFLFGTFLLFRTETTTRVGGRWGMGLINLLFGLILAPSALWMPLTLAMAERPSPVLWAATCVVLALVGLGSLGLLAALMVLCPRKPAWHYVLAIIGAIPFCIQTALLDAMVWTSNFPH